MKDIVSQKDLERCSQVTIVLRRILMRVKIIEAMSTKSVEDKINEFLSENEELTILDIKLAAGFGNVVAMVRYEEAT